MKKKSTKPAAVEFEESLAELEKIVQRMEHSEQPLERTMQDFERGMALAEDCRTSLESAQQRVEKLVKKHGGYALQPIDQTAVGQDRDEDDDGDGEDEDGAAGEP